MPRRETIVQRGATIAPRVETTVAYHHVYRLLRGVDRDGWVREAIARFADRINFGPDPIPRSAGPIVRFSRSEHMERWSRTRALWVVPRDQTIRHVGWRITPPERSTRPHEWTIVHDAFRDRQPRRLDRSARAPHRTARTDDPTHWSTLSVACRGRSNRRVSPIAQRRAMTAPCDASIVRRGSFTVPRGVLT
jgi:hypothetical protein